MALGEFEHFPVPLRWFRLFGWRVLLSRPNVRQYGHLGLEIFFTIAKAAEHGVPAFFIRPRHVVIEALFDITMPDVKVIENSPRRQLFFGFCWRFGEALDDARRWLRRFRGELANERRRVITRYAARHLLSKGTRRRLKHLKASIRVPHHGGKVAAEQIPPYYLRRLISRPFRVTLKAAALARAEEAAQQRGIGPDACIVMLHNREPGWKQGREIQDLKPGGRDDSVRNARLEPHFPALDYLVQRGYTIVRMGDPSMRPLTRRGVVDLATATRRDPLLELYCLIRSRFIICGESGPLGVSYLTNTASLTVNGTDPISAFPIRQDSRYLLKTVVDRTTGRRLTLQELLDPHYLAHVRDTTRYYYVENTGSEILSAVQEMLALLDGRASEGPAQRVYREMITRTSCELRSTLAYVRKWGADEGFMGEGAIVGFLAERDFGVAETDA